MKIPKRICIKCKNEYSPVGCGQKLCILCKKKYGFPSNQKRTEYWKKYREKHDPYKKYFCKKCGKSFKAGGSRSKFCDKCKEKECLNCETFFIPLHSQYQKKFCCKRCYSEFQKGKQIPPNIQNKRGKKPRTYHLNPNKRSKHGGAVYSEWRTAIFKRDEYTCQRCGTVGEKLNADHIKPWAKYPELRYKLSNGRTLCILCHKKSDSYGWKNYWNNYLKSEIARKRLNQQNLF